MFYSYQFTPMEGAIILMAVALLCLLGVYLLLGILAYVLMNVAYVLLPRHCKRVTFIEVLRIFS